MRKIKGLVLCRLGAEAMVVAESMELVDFDHIVSLNASAAYVWESLADSDFDTQTIVRLLTDRYDVSEDVARDDAHRLVSVWLEAGIIVN